MIKIIFNGQLGADAEVKLIPNTNYQVIEFSAAHSRKKADGTYDTTWVRCTKWVENGKSTAIATYLKKGQTVLVEGEPNARAWNQADGSARAELTCRVIDLTLIGSKKDAQPGAPTTAQTANPSQTVTNQPNFNGPQPDDDLPF